MNQRPDNLHDYLRPPHGAFWTWQEGGEVVTWTDGKTIAFRQELREVLRRQVDLGLPPLGAVLLLLAAAHESRQESSSQRGILAGIIGAFDDAAAHMILLTEVSEGLDLIRQLDSDLLTSTAAKAELVDLVLCACEERTSPKTASTVVDYLGLGLPESISDSTRLTMVDQWWHLGAMTLERDLQHLAGGLAKVDEQSLRLRMRTGLETEVQAAQVDLSPAEQARALIEQLQDDAQLGGIARLARDLMAAVTLPRKVSQPDELPLGGVSDISNRGPLDRLLLSELAHDDLTLAVRVAVNEALYLRREAPPRTPPRTRALLLDCGLRTWGVPRVYGTAVALAAAATTDSHDEVTAWRAHGAQTEPVELTRREGVAEHLEKLYTDIHPGRALPELVSRLAAADGESDVILITTADTLADHDFQRAVGQCEVDSLFVASVERDGSFRLLHYSRQGRKILREAQLDLDKLLAEHRTPSAPLIERDGIDDLPAIFFVRPFPLLLSHPIDHKRIWCLHERGVFALTKDRRLMWWSRPGYGARQLADDLHAGSPQWHSLAFADYEEQILAVLKAPHGDQLLLLDIQPALPSCTVKSLPISATGVRAVSAHNGALMVIGNRRVHIFVVGDTEPKRTLNVPSDAVWQRDRFFKNRRTGQWLALAYDGIEASLESVLSAQTGMHCPKLAGLFDRVGHDGPWGVTYKGDLYDSATDKLHNVATGLGGKAELLAANRTGERIVIGRHSPELGHLRNNQCLIDVESRQAQRVRGNPWDIIDAAAIRRTVQPRSLRSRFEGVFEDGGLVLITRKGACHRLRWFSRQIQLQYDRLARKTASRPFERHPLPSAMGIRLQKATLDDGSEVFVDSRGLLHLRCKDRSSPEITLVLSDGYIAGWSSTGHLWGPKYFTGFAYDTEPTDDAREVLKRFVRGLP